MYTVGLTPKDAQAKIAEQIKALRKAAGFTQAELAQRAQCSLGSYKRFESSGLIAFDALLRIAFVLKRLEQMTTPFAYSPEPDFNQLFKNA